MILNDIMDFLPDLKEGFIKETIIPWLKSLPILIKIGLPTVTIGGLLSIFGKDFLRSLFNKFKKLILKKIRH